jgi:hypothetical protein
MQLPARLPRAAKPLVGEMPVAALIARRPVRKSKLRRAEGA